MGNKKIVKLSEADLHRVIKESVKRILKEEAVEYSNGDYIVADENKLGYVIGTPSENGSGMCMVVMAVDVMAGGDPNLINRDTYVSWGNVRKPTPEDEEKFNVRLF